MQVAGLEMLTLGFCPRTADTQPLDLERIIMPTKINGPSIIEAAGTRPKRIEEYIGKVNSGTGALSIARMISPAEWQEPGQRPAFDEYTLVLSGRLRVESEDGTLDILAGEAVVTHAGEWVRYSTPTQEGAEYIAVCLPAFSPETVHRDDSVK
jgi:mannose-6-phosphate isomerase-like protein (cupin superfamily)